MPLKDFITFNTQNQRDEVSALLPVIHLTFESLQYKQLLLRTTHFRGSMNQLNPSDLGSDILYQSFKRRKNVFVMFSHHAL